MAALVCLLQAPAAVELSKVKAWFKDQKLSHDIYDQAALTATVEAKSPLAQRLAAEQKVLKAFVAQSPVASVLEGNIHPRLQGLHIQKGCCCVGNCQRSSLQSVDKSGS